MSTFITDVKVILTAPEGINLLVVKPAVSPDVPCGGDNNQSDVPGGGRWRIGLVTPPWELCLT